jgi:hypothetical protein
VIPFYRVYCILGKTKLGRSTRFDLDDHESLSVPSDDIQFTGSIFGTPVPSHHAIAALL